VGHGWDWEEEGIEWGECRKGLEGGRGRGEVGSRGSRSGRDGVGGGGEKKGFGLGGGDIWRVGEGSPGVSSLGRYVFGSEISYNKAPPRLPGLGC
jgi:hypothetical protein